MATAFLKLCIFTRQHRWKVLAASSLGLFAVNISYHVFPKQTFRMVYQSYYVYEPVPISDKLRALFYDVLDETQLPSSGFTPFESCVYLPVSAGVPWLPGGCSIGIPINYKSTMEDTTAITSRALVFNGEVVDWRCEPGISLRHLLTLSVNAQKFSMAREAIHAQISGPILRASVGPLCLTGVCVSSVAIKMALGLYSKLIIFRGLFNVLAVLLGFTGYCLCYDSVSRWLDYRSDRKAAAVSKAYAEGGLEFYDKILEHNLLQRKFMGEDGKPMYAPNGNLYPRNILRMKHAPYTLRRDRILHALNKHQE